MVQSSPGMNSSTVPFSMRAETARSRVALVAKGHTGALFLLSEIVEAALSLGFPDMKRLVDYDRSSVRLAGYGRMTQVLELGELNSYR